MSGTCLFFLMAHDAHAPGGVALGALFAVVCAIGIVGAIAPFDDAALSVTSRVPAAALARPILATLAAFAGVWLSLGAAVHSVLPQWLAGGTLTLSFVALVAGAFWTGSTLGALRTDEEGADRPLLRRHGFWLFVVMAVAYLPALGRGSLVDPWETHYGEVAREIIARDDWISTWWSWEGFFYSKPILGIWAQSIAMATLGVHVEPGRMLVESAGVFSHPEWAVRFPFALFAMIGTYLLYKGASRWFGRQAAFLGGIVLATSADWFFLAHQSMTDMPYAASIAGAMGLFLYAVRVEDAREIGSYEVSFGGKVVRVHLWHLLFGAIALVVVPQILYLGSRNLELVLSAAGPHGFRPHLDEFRAGSGLGNCNQAGDPACATESPLSHFEPASQAAMWVGIFALLIALCMRERREKRLVFLAAWLFAALATMAKGPAGFGIPMACVGVWVAITGRWIEVPRTALVAGLLVIGLVVGPWVVAMVVRHGTSFTDELFFHDIFNRAFDHVHDTNAGADTGFVYYLEQLGFGLFPWTALLPIGLLGCGARKSGDKRRDGALLLLAWLGVTFALFTFMGTKFHHYIAPAVPPLAMLVGLGIDAFAGSAIAGFFSSTPTSSTSTSSAAPAASSTASAANAEKSEGKKKDQWPSPHARAMMGAAAVAGALLVALVARDLVEGQGRLMQLFTYRYDRPWPPSLDATRALEVTGGLAFALAILFAVPRLRRWVAIAWVVLGIGWAIWGLDVYLPETSPHWGQRAVIEAYYAERAGPEEPLAAYDLNWKGENFYTSNRISQFGTPTVPPNTPKFGAWVTEQRTKGTKVIFLVTERSRIAGLRKDVGAKEVREVTSARDSNQFVLMRAVL